MGVCFLSTGLFPPTGLLKEEKKIYSANASPSPRTVSTENSTSMLISKGRTFMSMLICGILPGAVNIPIVLLQEGLLPEVAGLGNLD